MNHFYAVSPQSSGSAESSGSESTSQQAYGAWNAGYASSQFDNNHCGYGSGGEQAYYCPPAPNPLFSTPSPISSVSPSCAAPPLPAISNLMKEPQVKEDYHDYYPSGQMSEFRMEKVVHQIGDPYTQLEQPIYADFTNAQLISQPDMMTQMSFANPLSASYMNIAPVTQPPAVPLNLFDFGLSTFPSFNSTCEQNTPQVPMHQSPSQQSYGMTPHSTFTPPPQDPLVADQKPIAKKRMAAVQCHQNSICSNCKTRETTLWRRNGEGGVECNACNLYYRKNNRKRPLSLRKDGIMKRNRRPRNQSPTGVIRRSGHAAVC